MCRKNQVLKNGKNVWEINSALLIFSRPPKAFFKSCKLVKGPSKKLNGFSDLRRIFLTFTCCCSFHFIAFIFRNDNFLKLKCINFLFDRQLQPTIQKMMIQQTMKDYTAKKFNLLMKDTNQTLHRLKMR